MFKRFAVSGLFLVSTLALLPTSSFAWDRDDRRVPERVEYRDHRDYRREIVVRDYDRAHFRRGYYDRFGCWHRN